MKLDLNFWANLTQIISVVILLPMGVWKAWKSINDRLTAQDDRLIRIESQFHRNGGSSLRDSIDRIDRDVAKLTGRFDQHIEEGNK
jgi:hypothetical protein